MTTFNEIIRLRNKSKTQDEIAQILGISRRSVIRYLKNGKIPVYQREKKSNRPDVFSEYKDLIEKKIISNPHILLNDLYEFIVQKGFNLQAQLTLCNQGFSQFLKN